MDPIAPSLARLQQVQVRYRDHTALHGIDLQVRAGQVLALLGRNGAGKSTLFKLLTGKLQPTAGQITVDNRLTVATAHQVMHEEDKELTVEEFFAKWSGAEPHDVKRKMVAVLDAVNLVAPADKKVKDFSGGQQARLLLASALIQQPDLLLLDEPTNHLDLDALVWLEAWLKRYQGTLVMISHDREFLDAITQVTLHLDETKLTRYTGNYTAFETQRAARLAVQQAMFGPSGHVAGGD